MRTGIIVIGFCVVLASTPVVTAEVAAQPASTWLASAALAADTSGPDHGPWSGPIRAPRTHTIEGAAGGVFVPTAYLMNPGPEGQIFGMPTVSSSFMGSFGRKNLWTLSMSQTLFRRVEMGYTLSRLDTGNLNHVVRKKVGNSMKDRGIWMHTFSTRVLLIEENSFSLPLPAVTVGMIFKYNQTINDINSRLGIPLKAIGYDDNKGTEYTLTVTKTMHFAPIPPIEVSVGLRNTKASNLGYLGFSEHSKTLIEVGVTMYPTDWLSVRYEFRRKERVFDAPPVAGMLEGEGNYHSLSVSIDPMENLSINMGIACVGNIANQEDAITPTFSVAYRF